MNLIPLNQNQVLSASPFQNFLITSPCSDEDPESFDDIKCMVDPQTLLQSIGNVPLPCLHNRSRKLCFDASAELEEFLDNKNPSDFPDSVNTFLTFSTAIRTSPYPLFCQRHQGTLMSEVKWSSVFVEKLMYYLVTKSDSEAKISSFLIRFLEIMINPPQNFGKSDIGQEFARQVKLELILESPQLCRVISSVFIFAPSPVRKRMCVDLQDNLIQMLDQEVITKEMLTLLYFLSFHGKANEDALDKLLSFIIDCFNFEQGEARSDFIDLAIQILVNFSQRFSESMMKDLMNMLYSKALKCYQYYKRNDILTHVISPLLNSTSFSNFIPVCIHFDQTLKINKSDGSLTVENNNMKSKLDLLTTNQQEDLLNYVQLYSRGFGPIQAFDIKWHKWDISKAPHYSSLRGSDSILLIFSYVIHKFSVKLVLYIGSKLVNVPVPVPDFQQIIELAKENLLFFCIDDGPLQIFDVQPTIHFGSDLDTLSLRINSTDQIPILEFNSIEILVYNYNLSALNPEYFVGRYSLATQQIPNPFGSISIYTGSSSLNINKLQEAYDIYGASHQATRFREVFETLRPSHKVFFVPKEISVNDFVTIVFQNKEDLMNDLQILHKQQIVNGDSTIGYLNYNEESSSLFEIIDLYINCPKCFKMKEVLASPPIVHQKIVQYSSQTINRPLLKYFSTYGNALGFLTKFATGDMCNIDPFGLLKLYEKINKALGPYMNMLAPIFGTDLLLILWHGLSKSSEADEQDILQLLYKIILRNMVDANLLASDPEQLYSLILEAIEYLFLNDVSFQHHFPSFLQGLSSILNAIRRVGLIQDSEIITLVVDAVGIKFHSFEVIFKQIVGMLTKNGTFMERVNDLFQQGSRILGDCCTDDRFYRTFTSLAETIQDLGKVSGYILALSKNELFVNTLARMVADMQKQMSQEPYRVKIDQTMEESMLVLIKCIYAALDKVIQYRSDISAETSLMNITKDTLDVLRFLLDELKRINTQKERGPVVMEYIKDITQNVTHILKKPAQSKRMCAQGFDAAHQFCVDYLAEMKKLNLAQTLTCIFDVLLSFKDEIFAFQMQIWILKLLQVWSEHEVLKAFFKQNVKSSQSQEIHFGELFIRWIKNLKKNINQPGKNDKESDKLSEIKKEMTAQVMSLLEIVSYNIYL